MGDTRIEYLEKSWNPLQSTTKGRTGIGYHCTKVDESCRFCWAESINQRFGNGLPFDNKPQRFEISKKELTAPFHWRKKRRVGVQFMGDLFHEDIPFDLIRGVFDVMSTDLVKTCDSECENCKRIKDDAEKDSELCYKDVTKHKYFVLTKRPERVHEFIKFISDSTDSELPFVHDFKYNMQRQMPSNIYIGISISDQKTYNDRIESLIRLKEYCTKIWISAEPLLGPVDLFTATLINNFRIDWLVVGCESGRNKKRYCDLDWMQQLVRQGGDLEIPVFVKQIMLNGEVIKSIDDFPALLQVREYPSFYNN